MVCELLQASQTFLKAVCCNYCPLYVWPSDVPGLPVGYSVIVALTGLPVGYSVIVALTGLLIRYNVIVASRIRCAYKLL